MEENKKLITPNEGSPNRGGNAAMRCPKCGRQVDSLQCGHCGSQLPSEQADLYGAVVRQLAKMGGNRSDAGHQGGSENDDQPDTLPHEDGDHGDDPTPTAGNVAKNPDLQNTQTPPSLCQWIFERLTDAGVQPNTILDPCAGNGNLTHPFRPQASVIEYEILVDRDFFEAKSITCDLAICNPRWSEAERWLRHLVEVVGKQTPIVFLCPMAFFVGYKDAPCRKYLETGEAPTLNHITPLPSDTFVKVYSQGAILWFNLPEVSDVALVPSRYLIRSNDLEGNAGACNESCAQLGEQRVSDQQTQDSPPAHHFSQSEVEHWKRQKLTATEEFLRRFFEDKSWFVGGPIPLRLLYGADSMTLVRETDSASGIRRAGDLLGQDVLGQLTDQMQKRGIDEKCHGSLALLYVRLCRGMPIPSEQAGLAS